MDQVQGAGLLGFGMNVVSMTPRAAVTEAVVAPVSGDSGSYTFDGIEYTVPENVSVVPGFGDNTTTGSVIVGNTRSEFQSKLSAQLGVTGSYNAFSGSFNFAFANELKSESQYSFAVVQGDYEAYTLLLQNEGQSALAPAFLEDPDVLALQAATSFDPADPGAFYRVFEKWGTHYVNQVAMGASLEYYAAVQSTFSSSEQTIGASLELEYNAVFVTAGATAKTDWNQLGKTWADDRYVSIVATGGNTDLLEALAPALDDNFNSQFEQWRASVTGQLGVQRYGVRDLSTLFSGAAAQAVGDALAAYLSYGLEGRAAFDTGGESVAGVASQITVNGVQQTPEPAPPGQSGGGIQLVAVDPTSLAVLSNTTAYAASWSDYAAAWSTIQGAADALTVDDAYVILTVFGATNGLCFPPAATAMWLQTCGASLEAMQAAAQYYCGEQYLIAYVLVGQQGMAAGAAVETFAMNTQGDHQPVESGYFFADAFGPLAPNDAGGFTLLGAGS